MAGGSTQLALSVVMSPPVGKNAWLGSVTWAEASYQRSTRNALKVFQRLGVASGSSNRKWTAPGCEFSSSQSPSGRRLARTRDRLGQPGVRSAPTPGEVLGGLEQVVVPAWRVGEQFPLRVDHLARA